MFCSHCGTKANSESRYCSECGEPLAAGSSTTGYSKVQAASAVETAPLSFGAPTDRWWLPFMGKNSFPTGYEWLEQRNTLLVCPNHLVLLQGDEERSTALNIIQAMGLVGAMVGAIRNLKDAVTDKKFKLSGELAARLFENNLMVWCRKSDAVIWRYHEKPWMFIKSSSEQLYCQFNSKAGVLHACCVPWCTAEYTGSGKGDIEGFGCRIVDAGYNIPEKNVPEAMAASRASLPDEQPPRRVHLKADADSLANPKQRIPPPASRTNLEQKEITDVAVTAQDDPNNIGKAIVCCPRCGKELRIPRSNSLLSVRCPPCDSTFLATCHQAIQNIENGGEKNEAQVLQRAIDEFETGKPDFQILAKAKSFSAGDASKVRDLYVRFRANALIDANAVLSRKVEEDRRRDRAKAAEELDARQEELNRVVPIQQRQQSLKESNKEMAEIGPYGIRFNGDKYFWEDYVFDILPDAIAYAERTTKARGSGFLGI